LALQKLPNRLRRLAFVTTLTVCAVVAAGSPALGQSPGEMCGDGTTFTVALPGAPGTGLPGDSVTLPNGCRMYALFVSGYSVSPALDYLSFYKLARFVAANDGYVHYAWWNNFFGEYLSRPLHGHSTPGNIFSSHVLGFVPGDQGDSGAPKAVPEEDTQFQADARRVLEEIRARNPDALIVVAGHSMGADTVVRLGASTSTIIDLLAPIDPVGNRTFPVGQVGRSTYNWTRWRVANDLRGYRQRDCVRNAVGLCQDFDPRLLHVSYQCFWGPLLTTPPVLGSRAPVACPQAQPLVVTGPRPRIGANVRFLYHRWQKEFPFPFDFGADERLERPGPLTGLLGGNYQRPLLKNAPGESDRDKTCGLSGSINLALVVAQVIAPGFVLPSAGSQPNDPRDPFIVCSPFDGHGEIVGLRGALVPHGVRAHHWPCYTALVADPGEHCVGDDPAERRRRFIDMATAPAPDPFKTIGPPANRGEPRNWPHEPDNPNLDLVVDDMLTIVQYLMDLQPEAVDGTAPVTSAATAPEPNANGWHMDDVQIDLSALDNPGGSGVKEIEYSTAGAHASGPVVAPGDSIGVIVSAEGITTLTFLARDHAGNAEAAQALVVRMDRTDPEISAVTDVQPNGAGWFNTAVTVSFAASDALSGLAHVSPDQTVATEGAHQEVTGTAEDLAGNLGSASAILNIDRTPPVVTITTPPDGATYLLNSSVHAGYGCVDMLSGVASCVGTVLDGAAIDTASVGQKTMTVSGKDEAGNAASRTHAYAVRYGFSGFAQPIASGTGRAASAGQVMPVKYALHDASGMPITDLASFVSLTSSPAACEEGGAAGPWESAEGAGRTVLRYDTRERQFVFNWRTDGRWAGSCRALRLELNDGTAHVALLRFR
jgi:hypothetical protein